MQTIEAFAHVAGAQAQIHPRAGRQVNHPRSTFNTVRNNAASTPELIRSRSPLANIKLQTQAPGRLAF